jgi:hypothetical protein
MKCAIGWIAPEGHDESCTYKFGIWARLRGLTVAEIFGVGGGVAEIIVDEHRGLAGKLEAFAALETGDQVVEPHHVRRGFGKLSPVFVAGAARQFPFLAGNFPAHGKLELAAAARADELDLPDFFFLRVKGAFVHG